MSTYNFNPEKNSANFRIFSRIENKEFRKDADTVAVNSNLSYRVRFTAPNGQAINLNDYNFNLAVNSDQDLNQTADINSPVLWSPSAPILQD
jgi:hypothetical protein